MSRAPTVSVVLPNFNHARLLPRCLDALLSQSQPPLEIILIDDASIDDSLDVIGDFARRHPCIRPVRNATNQGVVAGMNRGLELARGDYVLFAAADDYVLPGFLEKSVALLARHPEAALSCTIGDWHEVGTGRNLHVGVGMGDRPCYLPPARIAELEARGRLRIASHSALIHRERLAAAGGFPPELQWHADWLAITAIAFRHGVCFVPEPLARFFIYPDSYNQIGRHSRAHQEVLRKTLDLLLRPEFSDIEPLVRRSGAMFHFAAPLLLILLCEPRYRRFLTPTFLRKNLWHILKLQVNRFMPAFVANWYFRLAGYRARAPRPPA